MPGSLEKETVRVTARAHSPREIPTNDEAKHCAHGLGEATSLSEPSSDTMDLARLSNARFWLAAIAESSNDAIIGKDLQGVITSWNNAAEAIFGYTENEIIGRPITLIIPPDRMDEERLILRRIRNGERIEHLETQRRRKDGTIIPISLTVSPIRDEQGRLIGASKIARDCSQRDARERQLRENNVALQHAKGIAEQAVREKEQQRQELERSNADLQTFAYIASHDLKAPLRGIAQLAEWISEDIGSTASPETLDNLKMLLGRVARLQMLLDGLLAYARLGRDQSDAEAVDIPALIRDIIADSPPPPGFVVTCAEPLPPIHTHRMAIRAALDNLIGNGWKHHDRAEGRISVAVRLADGVAEFRVSDDGPGISPQFHTKIFEIFQTLASRDSVEANGLGLAIVKRLIESHGGRIGVESVPPDRGTTFAFTWQLATPHASASARGIAGGERQAGVGRQGGSSASPDGSDPLAGSAR